MTDKPKFVAGQKVYRVYLNHSEKLEVHEATVVHAGVFLTLDQRSQAWDYRVKVEPGTCSLTPAEALEAFQDDRRRGLECLRSKIHFLERHIEAAGRLKDELKLKEKA